MNSVWPLQPLDQVCQIKPPKAEARRRVPDDGLVSFVPMEDLGIDEKFVSTTQARPLSEVSGSYTYFADGDVLLAKITPCFENGKLGIAESLTNGIGFGSSEYIVFRPNEALNREWLYYYLSREAFREQGAAQMSGAVGHKRVSKTFVENYKIPMPPLDVQRRIVETLDEAFDAIQLAADRAERNFKNTLSLFLSYLQSVVSPDRAHEASRLRTLSEVSIEFGRGRSRHRPRNDKELYGGKYPFIQTGDVRSADHYITSYTQTYNEAGLAQSKLWPQGTVCITIAANIAETGILGFDACFPDSVIGVVVDPNEADAAFVEYLLQSFRAQLQAQGKGSAQDNINLGTFVDQRFPFPPIGEQRRVVDRLDALAADTRKLAGIERRKLVELAALKESLLSSAFAGRLEGAAA